MFNEETLPIVKGTFNAPPKKKKKSDAVRKKQLTKYLARGQGAAEAAASEMRISKLIIPYLQRQGSFLPEQIHLLYDDMRQLEYAYRGVLPHSQTGIESTGKYGGHQSINTRGSIARLSLGKEVPSAFEPASSPHMEGGRSYVNPGEIQSGNLTRTKGAMPADRATLAAMAKRRFEIGGDKRFERGFPRPAISVIKGTGKIIREVPGKEESLARIAKGQTAKGMYGDYLALEKALLNTPDVSAQDIYSESSGRGGPEADKFWQSATEEADIINSKKQATLKSIDRILRKPETTYLGPEVGKQGLKARQLIERGDIAGAETLKIARQEKSFMSSGRLDQESIRHTLIDQEMERLGGTKDPKTGKWKKDKLYNRITQTIGAKSKIEGPAIRLKEFGERMSGLREAEQVGGVRSVQGVQQGEPTPRPPIKRAGAGVPISSAYEPLVTGAGLPIESAGTTIPRGVGQPRAGFGSPQGPQVYGSEEAYSRGLSGERAAQISEQHAEFAGKKAPVPQGQAQRLSPSRPAASGGWTPPTNPAEILKDLKAKGINIKAKSNLKTLLPLLILMGVFGSMGTGGNNQRAAA